MVIYDSLPSICIDKRTREQIAAILQCTEYREIKVTVPSVQRQNGRKIVVYLPLLLQCQFVLVKIQVLAAIFSISFVHIFYCA